MNLKQTHQFSSNHRKSILKSNKCGCFHCLAIISPNKIGEWVDEDEKEIGQTALCPECDIDSLIGNYDVNFDENLLKEMQKYWF